MKKLLIIPILLLAINSFAQVTVLGPNGKIKTIDTLKSNLNIMGTYLVTPSDSSLTFDSTKVITDVTKNATRDSFQFKDGAGTIIKTLKDSVGITDAGVNTLTNKRWIPRVDSTTSSATPTINTDNVDIYKITALAVNITSFTTNLSGSPNGGEVLEIQITGTATRTISWGASFASTTVTLPTTTSSTATLTIIFQYYKSSSYGNNKWLCVNYY